MAFTKIATLTEVPPGTLIEIIQGENVYAVCNVAGELRALSGVCPHNGGPLGQGALDGSTVTCPWHAWEFDSGTGACTFDEDIKVPVYKVRVDGDEILMDTESLA